MELKKFGRTTIIQLSQLNRNIEEPARINNPNAHFPLRNDLFGSDSIYHASDYVFVLHRPEVLGIIEYGPLR
jgi:replicative DNA helicase